MYSKDKDRDMDMDIDKDMIIGMAMDMDMDLDMEMEMHMDNPNYFIWRLSCSIGTQHQETTHRCPYSSSVCVLEDGRMSHSKPMLCRQSDPCSCGWSG